MSAYWRLLTSLLILLVLLTACRDASSPQTGKTLAQGKFQEYPLPQDKSGLMRPTVDGRGRVWFAEMGTNALGVFDPQSSSIEQIEPPQGAHGLMGIVAAPDNTIWFAEQYANYIGHYQPETRQFQTYPLPTLAMTSTEQNAVDSLPSGANDLALDAQGNVWFTEMNADAIGKLDPHSGQIRQYPISHPATIQKFDPYGITIDPQGTVWFTEAATNQLGRLNPQTGELSLFPFQQTTNSLLEVISDPQGIIWGTTFRNSTLFRFDPHTQHFTTYQPESDASGCYGIARSASGEIWLTLPSANQLARFTPTTSRFTLYPLPSEGNSPFGIASDPTSNKLWFTESATNKLGMLQP
ncbi:Vgb family protein [Tengunoibacter tsumagoiensis]|uniref:Hydrolase n=1 Tax=Tengunoibacter tsumagoiensis TaxID=2014871 RepID=A0A401ZZE5_9CHLR|nr:SMP-30/gluconolactonase/LRE family protein [Tengunoibacter tsumagoiensis]GCE12227.1 hydrolase [Tengunoibacter tsumagoiensis]